MVGAAAVGGAVGAGSSSGAAVGRATVSDDSASVGVVTVGDGLHPAISEIVNVKSAADLMMVIECPLAWLSDEPLILRASSL